MKTSSSSQYLSWLKMGTRMRPVPRRPLYLWDYEIVYRMQSQHTPVVLSLFHDTCNDSIDVNNNVPRKNETRKRKAPARPLLVARSIRDSQSPQNSRCARSKRKIRPKKSKQLIPMNKKSIKVRKAKHKRKSPTSITTRSRKRYDLRSQDSPSASADNQSTTVKKSNKKTPKLVENMNSLVSQVVASPRRFFMNELKIKHKPTVPAKQQESAPKRGRPRKIRDAQSTTMEKSNADRDVTPEWPSVGESSRRKRGVKEAATSIVRNRLPATVAQLSRQKYVEGVPTTCSQLDPTEASCSNKSMRSWASVAAVKLENCRREIRYTKSNIDSQGRNMKTTTRKSEEKSATRHLADDSRRHTIEKRRSARCQKARAGSDAFDTTSHCANGDLRWKIDHMPENLRFTRPVQGVVSLRENHLESASSDCSSTNVNLCNNRRVCLGDFISDAKNEGPVLKSSSEATAVKQVEDTTVGNRDLSSGSQLSVDNDEDLGNTQLYSGGDDKEMTSVGTKNGADFTKLNLDRRQSDTDICSLFSDVTMSSPPLQSERQALDKPVSNDSTNVAILVSDNTTDLGSNATIQNHLGQNLTLPMSKSNTDEFTTIAPQEILSNKQSQQKIISSQSGPPKKVSLRYRALLREGPAAATTPNGPSTSRGRKHDIPQVSAVVARNKRRRRSQNVKQTCQDSSKDLQDTHGSSDNTMLQIRGTSAVLRNAPGGSFTAGVESSLKKKDGESRLAGMQGPKTRSQTKTSTFGGSTEAGEASSSVATSMPDHRLLREGTSTRHVIVCDDSGDDEVNEQTGNEERVGVTEEQVGAVEKRVGQTEDPTDNIDLNNSFPNDVLCVLRESDIPPARVTGVTSMTQVTLTDVRQDEPRSLRVLSESDMPAGDNAVLLDLVDDCSPGDIDVHWWMAYLFGESDDLGSSQLAESRILRHS